MSCEEMINNYAHDYRDIAMDEKELARILKSFLEEVENEKKDNL